jgi:hypothetical protein
MKTGVEGEDEGSDGTVDGVEDGVEEGALGLVVLISECGCRFCVVGMRNIRLAIQLAVTQR